MATAAALMGTLDKLGVAMNDVAVVIERISDEDERLIFRKAIGKMMGESFTEIMLPVIREHPGLDPDRRWSITSLSVESVPEIEMNLFKVAIFSIQGMVDGA